MPKQPAVNLPPVDLTKRPSVTNVNIPVHIQRELNKIADYAFNAHQNANAAIKELPNKFGRNKKDLSEIAKYSSGALQADGPHPMNLTGLQLGNTGVAPGTYSTGSGASGTIKSFQVGSDGRIVSIVVNP